jgi:hypothetical protein
VVKNSFSTTFEGKAALLGFIQLAACCGLDFAKSECYWGLIPAQLSGTKKPPLWGEGEKMQYGIP